MKDPILLPPLSLTVSKKPQDIYKTYVNFIMAASDNKISDQEKEIIEECYYYCDGRFDADGRKTICDRLGVSVSNLNNYIKKLRDKQYIDEENRLSPQLNVAAFRTLQTAEEAGIKITFKVGNLKPVQSQS